MSPKICLCLTAETLEKDLQLVNKYRHWIDMVELRADHLTKDERLHIRSFPSLAGLPCILTIRRRVDGGCYQEGEASRVMLFARALAFAEQDSRKNFAYVDFESDFQVPSLQDAAFAFGTRVIRSYHDMKNPVTNIAEKMRSMRITGYEIPKIACMPHSLSDVTALFREAKGISGFEYILCAMGEYGLPTRILAHRLGSHLTYVSPAETMPSVSGLGHTDPVRINEIYNFRSIDSQTKLFGIAGYPLTVTQSPEIHNAGYRMNGINAVYIPLRAARAEEALKFADELGMEGLSVTVPHKEAVMNEMQFLTAEAGEIGSCNTVIRKPAGWTGYNTDAYGLMQAIKDFLDVSNLARWKVAVIGAGGAARAAAYAVKMMKGKACIFNRTAAKAKSLAEAYNFKWAPLTEDSLPKLERYSDLIIQTTSVGMGTLDKPSKANDPLFFYDFKGTEAVYDIVYSPEKTPVMIRAAEAGCRVSNGYSMLKYQAYMQFFLFTGEPYDKDSPYVGVSQ